MGSLKRMISVSQDCLPYLKQYKGNEGQINNLTFSTYNK